MQVCKKSTMQPLVRRRYGNGNWAEIVQCRHAVRLAAYPSTKRHSKSKPNDEETGYTLLPKSHPRPCHDPGTDAARSEGIGS